MVASLQEAMGSVNLTPGIELPVPQNLVYSVIINEVDTTSVIDPLGHISSYRYDSEGKLTQILSPALTSGQRLSTQYQYDAQDNLIKVIDGRANAIDYSYNSYGNLTRQQDAASNIVEYSYIPSNLSSSLV